EVEVLVSGLAIGDERVYIGIVHDISQRKRMERKLRASEAVYRATFDQALVGIVYADLTSRVTRANRTFCEMLGYSEQELLMRTFADITHPEDGAASVARVGNLLEDPTGFPERHATKRYVRKDGTVVWVIVSVSLVCGHDGRPDYFLTVVQDITEI